MRSLSNYAKICMEELDSIGIEYGNIVEFIANGRMKRKWGQCKLVPGGYSIYINASLLDEKNSEEGLKNTIIHEILHTCEGCMNHGQMWKQLAEKVNKAYGYNIKRCSSADEKGVQVETLPKAKYTVICDCCGHVYIRTRMSKLIAHPERFACGRCGGNLVLA